MVNVAPKAPVSMDGGGEALSLCREQRQKDEEEARGRSKQGRREGETSRRAR